LRGKIPQHGLPESDHVKAINAAQANSSAAPLTNMFIHVSFREMECF